MNQDEDVFYDVLPEAKVKLKPLAVCPASDGPKQPGKPIEVNDKVLGWLSTNNGYHSIAEIKKYVRCDLSKDEFEKLLFDMSKDGQLDCDNDKFAIALES